LLRHPGPDLGHSVGGSAAGGEHGSHIAMSSREGVRVTLGGVKGTACVITGAQGVGDVAGAGGGTEGAGTGVGAVVQACTSQLAWLHFFLVCQKTSALMPLPPRISSKKMKRVFFPLLTGWPEGKRVTIHLIREVWNARRKLAHTNWPLSSQVAERTLVIRWSWWMNHRDRKMFRMSKTEYLLMASRAGIETRGTGGTGVGGDWVGERGHLDPARIDDSPKGGTMDDAGVGEVRAANGLYEDMVVRKQEACLDTILPLESLILGLSASFFSEPETNHHRPLSCSQDFISLAQSQ
jgi:hypothetical protein